MCKRLIIIIITFLYSAFGIGQQNSKQLDALNTFVNYTNESIHGMLIVHRLLENFNQDINEYVDLESQQLNFYSNKDLPKNIFEDPERWFYQVPPLSLYEQLAAASTHIKHKKMALLNKECTILKNIFNVVNKLRFDVEESISTNDLTNNTGLQKVYDLLERGVKMYDDFHKHQIKIEGLIEEIGTSLGIQKTGGYNELLDAHYSHKAILRALRTKDDANMLQLIVKAQKGSRNAIAVLTKATDSTKDRRISQMKNKMSEALSAADQFYKSATVTDDYKLYGKFYYYHNASVISKMNRYGNGYVFEANEMIKEKGLPWLNLIEEVHFYQVIYPKKLKETELIISTDSNIESTPIELKLRSINKSDHVIDAETEIFEIQLYDHKIQDGDIVSINYNGDWILENHSLEGASTTLKLQLNKTGKNYLLLHAENVGRNPPNTMAVAYKKGEEIERIIIASDLNESALIEINLMK